MAYSRGSWQNNGAQTVVVGRLASGALKPVREFGPKFRAPYSGYNPSITGLIPVRRVPSFCATWPVSVQKE